MYGLDNYAYYEEKLRQYLYDSVNKVMCALNGLAAKCGQRQSVCEYIAKRMNITTGSTLERERGQQCVHREAQHLFLEYQSFLKSVDAYKSCESQ
jgi:hypothetical protein